MGAKKANRLSGSPTRAFFREFNSVAGAGWWDRVHGYIYGAFPYLYIKVGVGEHRLSPLLQRLFEFCQRLAPAPPGPGPEPGFADTYHGKVVPLELATHLVTVDRSIDLGDLDQVIPYALARDIVLKNPDHIVALECPCRAARANPCLPLDVCLIIGEPFASFVATHHPRRSRWISQEQAVEILRAEEKRGHVHHAFFKDAMLGRFYAICNCCSCCCGAMQAQRNGVPMLCPSGYRAQVDQSRCQGCGDCAARCQFQAVSLKDDQAWVDPEACMGCGVCASHCKHQAVRLVRDPAKGQPLAIFELMNQAAAG